MKLVRPRRLAVYDEGMARAVLTSETKRWPKNKKRKKAPLRDVLRRARVAAYSEPPYEYPEDPRFLMAAIDKQATRTRHAVRKGIPTSARREIRVMALLLAVLDDCFRKRRG